MPNRYNIYNSDGYHNLSVSQSEDGEWVRYDDIAALIAATAPERSQEVHVTDTLREMVLTGEAKVIGGEVSQPCGFCGKPIDGRAVCGECWRERTSTLEGAVNEKLAECVRLEKLVLAADGWMCDSCGHVFGVDDTNRGEDCDLCDSCASEACAGSHLSVVATNDGELVPVTPPSSAGGANPDGNRTIQRYGCYASPVAGMRPSNDGPWVHYEDIAIIAETPEDGEAFATLARSRGYVPSAEFKSVARICDDCEQLESLHPCPTPQDACNGDYHTRACRIESGEPMLTEAEAGEVIANSSQSYAPRRFTDSERTALQDALCALRATQARPFYASKPRAQSIAVLEAMLAESSESVKP
jgi:hypothetical protein